MPPQLEQIVGAAQQLPLRLAGTQPAALESSDAADVFDLAEDRLDGLLPLGVAGLPSSLASLAVIAARSPSLLDSDGLPSLRGLPWRPCRAGGISSSGASESSVGLAIVQ
jgi:hypothetical protein